MNKGRIVAVFLAFLTLFSITMLYSTAPRVKTGPQDPECHRATWTVMVYLNGHNACESDGIKEFLDIAAMEPGPGIHILAQLDRGEGHDARYDNWQGARRFYLKPGITPSAANSLMDLGILDSGDPATLFDFIHWSKTSYPAKNYALILWNRHPQSVDMKLSGGKEQLNTAQIDSKGSLFLEEIKKVLAISGGVNMVGYDHSDLDHLFKQLDHTLAGTDYYTESILPDFFFNQGTGQNISADDSYLTYSLPFEFPFFGEYIAKDTPIYISTNGYVDFNSSSNHSDAYNSTSGLTANKRIAPCWADLRTDGTAQQSEDIYIKENPDSLIIRWVAETFGDAEPVNVEAVLFRDGGIQFNYGAGNGDITPNDTPPTVGISKGDTNNYLLSEYNGDSTLNFAGADLYTPHPSISLTAPNGNESWEAGRFQDITWKSIGAVADVKLEYSVNNGESYQLITACTENTGSYVWLIPDESSQNCLVRITQRDEDDPVGDTSDDNFSITTPQEPGIIVLSPRAAGVLTAGYLYEIRWSCVGTVNNVAIDYSTTAGETWVNIVSSYDNTGSYMWQVPTTTSTQCKVRVRETDNSPLAVSGGLFTIQAAPTIALTAPNGGESWSVRSAKQITWTSTGIQDVKIEYSTTGGETWNHIVKVPNLGYYDWIIPDDISSTCKVRVTGEDNDQGPSDMSDQTFSITSGASSFIMVISPNGGERITTDSYFPIKWEKSETVGNVRIDYTLNNGESWNLVVESTDNADSYTWSVPGQASGTCKIKISEVNNEIQDISDAVFELLPQSGITVTAPNGGESWACGSLQQITWSRAGGGGNVRIEFSSDNGQTWQTIAATTPNNGSLNWEVPGPASTTCLIRITAYDTDGAPYDVSNTAFTVTCQ